MPFRPAHWHPLNPNAKPQVFTPLQLRLKALGFNMSSFARWIGRNQETVANWQAKGTPIWANIILTMLEERRELVLKLNVLPAGGGPLKKAKPELFPEPRFRRRKSEPDV